MDAVKLTSGTAAPQAGPATPSATPGAGERLVSLDLLRGFDMFWISGGDSLFKALATATGWAWAAGFATELEHVEWQGFHYYDLIFPLFLFISGLTLPIVTERRLARGESRGRMVLNLLRRALILVVLGILYNTGAVSFDFANIRFTSVLGRIGVAGFGAGVIVLYSRPRAWAAWVVGILAGYWALLTFVTAPGQPAHSFEMGRNIVDWLDQRIMPGKLASGVHDAIGFTSMVPAVATGLLGALAGAWLKSSRSAWRKTLGLLIAGALLWGAGRAWGMQLPVIKHLWTSSYVVLAAGWSCLLLALFYAVADGLRWRRWGFPFLLIGLNPLTLYFLRGTGLIDFGKISSFLFGWATRLAARPWRPFCQDVALLGVELAFLFWLYRKKIFLRV